MTFQARKIFRSNTMTENKSINKVAKSSLSQQNDKVIFEYHVYASPGAKRNLVVEEQDLEWTTIYKIYTTAKPVDWQANDAILSLLAQHLGIKKYQLKLTQWAMSRRKIFEGIM